MSENTYRDSIAGTNGKGSSTVTYLRCLARNAEANQWVHLLRPYIESFYEDVFRLMGKTISAENLSS